MEQPFTDAELEILAGKYPSIAETLGVSDTYLKYLARGQRTIKSKLSKKCYKKLQDTVSFFSPKKTA